MLYFKLTQSSNLDDLALLVFMLHFVAEKIDISKCYGGTVNSCNFMTTVLSVFMQHNRAHFNPFILGRNLWLAAKSPRS